MGVPTSAGTDSQSNLSSFGFDSPATTLIVAGTTMPTSPLIIDPPFFTTVIPPSTGSSLATATMETRTAWIISQTTIAQAAAPKTSRPINLIIAFACGIAFVAIAIVIMTLVIIRRDRKSRKSSRKPPSKDEIDPFLFPAEDLRFQYPSHGPRPYRKPGIRATKAESDSTESTYLVNDVVVGSPTPMTSTMSQSSNQLTSSERSVFTRLLEERTLEQHLLQFLKERIDTPSRPSASQTRDRSSANAGLPPRYRSQNSDRLNS